MGSFILCQGKRGTQQASTSRIVPPSLRNSERAYCQGSWSRVRHKDQGSKSCILLSSAEFQKGGIADKIKVCAGSQGGSPNLDELLWSLESCLRWFPGCSSLDLQLFESALWKLREGHGGWSLAHKKWGTKRPPCLGAPQGPTRFHFYVALLDHSIWESQVLCCKRTEEALQRRTYDNSQPQLSSHSSEPSWNHIL